MIDESDKEPTRKPRIMDDPTNRALIYGATATLILILYLKYGCRCLT